MDNQHRKIKGYRELTQEEIDLMNKIKQFGIQLDELIHTVKFTNAIQHKELTTKIEEHQGGLRVLSSEELQTVGEAREVFFNSDWMRWVAMAQTDLQVGLMKLTRAVAKPQFF